MPTDTSAASETDAIGDAASHAAETISAAADQGKQTIAEAAKAAETAIREALETLHEHLKPYRENAGQQFDEAQRYLTEKVKERPMTAAAAGLGIGLLLGLMLSNRSR